MSCDQHNGVAHEQPEGASFMQVCDPSNQFRRVDTLDIQVVHQTALAATRQHALQLQSGAWIDLLVRDIGRDVDKITSPRLRFKLQTLAPAQSCDSVENIDYGLEVAMVMGTGFRVRLNR